MNELIVVTGAGGFIGGHLVGGLLQEGHRVRAVDSKPESQWSQRFPSAENLTINLEEKTACLAAVEGCEQVYNFASDMGGMGFIELDSSSACVYAGSKQQDSDIPGLKEEDAYPADSRRRLWLGKTL